MQETTDQMQLPITSHLVDSELIKSEVVSTEPPEEPDISTHPTLPLRPPKRAFEFNWWSITAILLLLFLLGEHLPTLMSFLSTTWLPKTATVTIFPQQKHMQETYQFFAVTGAVNQSQHQIPSRIISFTSPTKTETITTTGVGYTPAIQATGTLTLYNAAIYSQTISAGTVITGRNGIQVITDQSITIGAGNPPEFGIASVSAHSIHAGTVGNIQPLAIDSLCCIAGISVKNTAAFSGGADPKAYFLLSQADLDRETKPIEKQLLPLATTAIQNQIREREQFLQPTQCKPVVTSIPNRGMRATTATVSVSETCNAQLYDFLDVQTLTKSQFFHDAGNFLVHGHLSMQLAKVSLLDRSHSTYLLMVSVQGTLQFHLTFSQLHILTTQIAGKKIMQVQRELLGLAGVQGVYIQLVNPSDTTLPSNPNQIHIIVS